MTVSRRNLFIIVASVIGLALGWTFDPLVWRVRLRYPSANITDCHEYGFFAPAFLHSRITTADDLYDGAYLHIEISDKSVDLNQFRDVPFFFLVLKRCKLTDIRLIQDTQLGHRGIWFQDCDLSAIHDLPFRGIADTRHVTLETDPQ